MGCAGSKLDDLPAVALCRDRSHHLAEAIRHRYALADAHLSYLHSLRSVGLSLQAFFDTRDLLAPPSPVLSLPTQRKGDLLPPPSPTPYPPPAAAPAAAAVPAAPTISSATDAPRHSDAGSHLEFHSSDSDLSDDDDGPLHSGHSSPFHHHLGPAAVDPFAGGGFTTYMNYAQKGPAAPSVSYEQRPMSTHAVQVGEPQHYSYPYPGQNPNYYDNPYPGQNPNQYGNPYPYPAPNPGYGGIDGFFGASSPPVVEPPQPTASASSSRPPPPPPSPPKASTWDFLNPFESYESYYPPYTPSRSSRELREEEGIPDLEEENEVVKEAYGDQKFVVSAAVAVRGEMYASSKAAIAATLEEGRRSIGAGEGSSSNPEYEAHMVDKNVVAHEVQPRQPEESARPKLVPGSRGAFEVVQEIKAHFDRATDSCDEVSKMLEAGKHQYHQKKYEVVSSKMMSTIVPPMSKISSQPSTSRSSEPSSSAEKRGFVYLDFDEQKAMKSGSLSSTLHKLYIWEKKLYEEVKAEEKMRVLYDRNGKRLKHLDERGAESQKLDRTQALVKKLSTKIRIAIQVVDSISCKISKLRDEELWPQLNELIQGLVRMWKVMMECHGGQLQVIIESKNLDAIASSGKLSDAHMGATKQLELELLNWIDTFCTWFNAQKSFVNALNGWLFRCLLYEPEETADGIVPFSPGGLGAPPVFVICHQWSQEMENISEKEVVDAMGAFATSVLQLWERHKLEERQGMMANREMDARLKAQEKEDQMIRKAVDALNKKLTLVSAQNNGHTYVQLSYSPEVSIHSGLRQLFVAMENFADSSMKIYEKLRIRSEEERVGRENAKVP